MAKQNAAEEAGVSKILAMSDDELLGEVPKLDELSLPPPVTNSPLELKLAQETKAGAGTKQDITTNTEQKQVAPPAAKKQTVKEGEIEYSLPQNSTPKPPGEKSNFSQFNTPPPQNTTQNTQVPPTPSPESSNETLNYGEPIVGDDFWNVSQVKNQGTEPGSAAGGGGSGPTDPGFSEGEMDGFMEDANADLAETALLLYENLWLDGLKENVKLDLPDLISEMMQSRVRRDWQKLTLQEVIEYNNQIDAAFKLSPEKKRLLKHAVNIILNKYSGFAETITPEFQAAIILGRTLWSDYRNQKKWQEPSKQLLERLDERLSQMPKEAAPQPETSNTVKTEAPKSEKKAK